MVEIPDIGIIDLGPEQCAEDHVPFCKCVLDTGHDGRHRCAYGSEFDDDGRNVTHPERKK